MVDAERIEQVIRNLVDNALKFTPEGGHVAVELSEGAASWVIGVRDDGRGISAEALPQVFDEFWQGESQGLERRQGPRPRPPDREAPGGASRRESSASRATGGIAGRPLRVELPKPGASGDRRRAAASPAPDLSGVEVVVVDDDVATVEAIGVALGRVGAIRRLAKSVPEALLLPRARDARRAGERHRPARSRRLGLDPHGARALRAPSRSILAIAVTGLRRPGGAPAHPPRGLRRLSREARGARRGDRSHRRSFALSSLPRLRLARRVLVLDDEPETAARAGRPAPEDGARGARGRATAQRRCARRAASGRSSILARASCAVSMRLALDRAPGDEGRTCRFRGIGGRWRGAGAGLRPRPLRRDRSIRTSLDRVLRFTEDM